MSRSRGFAALSVLAVALAVPSLALGQDAKPKPMLHDGAGREQCLMCHGGAMEGVPAAPATHEGRENEACLVCHTAESPIQTGTPTAIPHDLAGRENCAMCHGGAMEGVPATPANHEGIDVKFCGVCHKPAG